MTDTAYFVAPTDGPGPGVLLLHSWWGLTRFFRRFADQLADEGYTVLAPDLNFGATFAEPDLAQEHLEEADADRMASLTLNSAKVLQERSGDPERGIAVVGFSMGASLGLWASVRLPETIGAVAAFYGTQSIDFAGSRSSYQIHLAGDDELVSSDEAAFMEATIGLEERPLEVHRYPGVSHWFFEADREAYEHDAAQLARERLLEFLERHLD